MIMACLTCVWGTTFFFVTNHFVYAATWTFPSCVECGLFILCDYDTTGGHTVPLTRDGFPHHQSCHCRPLCGYPTTSSDWHHSPAGPPPLCLQWWSVPLTERAACPPAPVSREMFAVDILSKIKRMDGGYSDVLRVSQGLSSCCLGTERRISHKGLPFQKGFDIVACPLLAPPLRSLENRDTILKCIFLKRCCQCLNGCLAQKLAVPGSMTLPAGYFTTICLPSKCFNINWKPHSASTRPILWVICRSLPSLLNVWLQKNN